MAWHPSCVENESFSKTQTSPWVPETTLIQATLGELTFHCYRKKNSSYRPSLSVHSVLGQMDKRLLSLQVG